MLFNNGIDAADFLLAEVKYVPRFLCRLLDIRCATYYNSRQGMINPTPPTHPPRHLKQLSLAGGPRPLHLTSPSTSQFGLQSASPTSPLVRSNSGNSNTPSKRPNAPKRLSSISYSTSTRNVLATPMVSPGLRSAPLRLPEGVENAPGSESSSPRLSRAEGPDFPPTVLTLAERLVRESFPYQAPAIFGVYIHPTHLVALF